MKISIFKNLKASALLFTVTTIMIFSFFTANIYADAQNSTSYGKIVANGEELSVYTYQKSGNDTDNFVILYLGDGYTTADQETFISDVSLRVSTLLDKEPYRSMADKINIYAVPTVSAESGASYADSNLETVEKDTYYSISMLGKAGIIRSTGKDKARAIRQAMENSFLDKGATVKNIHIISNSSYEFGGAETTNSIYSCASRATSGGLGSLHEMSHSIGGLKDEYSTSKNPSFEAANASASGTQDIVKWKNFLGYRGVGIKYSDYGGTIYVPTHSCIMKELGNKEFCEVCKAELVRRMSYLMESHTFNNYYIANPDITIEHGYNDSYDNYKLNYANISNVNNHNLEFRTIIQNLSNINKSFRLVLKITDQYGTEKYISQNNFVIPALLNLSDYEQSQKSVSVTINNVTGIQNTDIITGEVIDLEKNTVVATHKSDKAVLYKVKINHKIKDKNGNISDMPNTMTTSVRVPRNISYTFPKISQLNGYTYIGNSENASSAVISELNYEIDYYYQEPLKKEIDVQISVDKKNFTITPKNLFNENDTSKEVYILLALYDNDNTTLKEVKSFTYNSGSISYTTDTAYSRVKVFAWDNLDNLSPICKPFEDNFS